MASLFIGGVNSQGAGVLLPYDRTSLTSGSSFGTPMLNCLGLENESAVIAIELVTPRLGDTLLALGAVRAVCDWLSMDNPHRRIRGRLREGVAAIVKRVDQPIEWEQAKGTPDIILSDTSVEYQECHSINVSRTALNCYIDEVNVRHSSLAARQYLNVEKLVGRRLPTNAPFCPRLVARNTPRSDELRRRIGQAAVLACVTTTSMPERKDFGRSRFLDVLVRVAKRGGYPKPLILVVEEGTQFATEEEDVAGIPVITLSGWGAEDLLTVLAHSLLVVGNDTGLVHLAAMARDGVSEAQVIGIYARHSHTRWRTDLLNHHAIATDYSDWLSRTDRSAFQEVDAKAAAPEQEALEDIATDWVADQAETVLRHATRAGQ